MKIYLGDIDSPRENKTQMPMESGYLRKEKFNIERRARTASGRLVTDIVATKQRFMFIFPHILADDFDAWDAQYMTDRFREIEIERQYGTFEKVIVEFGPDYGAQRYMTRRNKWVYSGVQFVFEEV